MSAPFEAFFLAAGNSGAGQRLCIHHPPGGGHAACGAVLHLHAFAEEMNKSRRMVALQARALAEAGFAVLQIDLHGCGDSGGDFGDATWESWLADAAQGAAWLREHCAGAPLTLWGLRAGALLAVQAAARLPAGQAPAQLLLWQPPASGKQMLQQFLRLKTAREALAGGDAKAAGDAIRRQLAAGEAVEIAGYALNPLLASGLEAATLTPPQPAGRAIWIEVGSQPEPSPGLRMAAERWSSAGWATHLKSVPGPAFWQSTEIETASALLPATLEALCAREAVAA